MFAYARKKSFVIPRLESDETPTKKDMAFSLSDMDKLRMEGKPISNVNLSNDYYDGDVVQSPQLSLEQRRGIDLNDAWNASKEAGQKLSKAKVNKVDINPVKS